MSKSRRPPRTAALSGGREGQLAARHLALLLALLAASMAAARADTAPLGDRIQLNGTVARSSGSLRVTQSIGEPLATAGPLPPQDALRADRPQSARQTMLWAEHQRSGLGVGIGVEQRRTYGGAALAPGDRQPQMEGGMLMGVSLATGPRSHLVVQTPLMTPAAQRGNYGALADDPQFLQDQQRQVRMGLVFNTRKPYSDLRQGLRMELSGQTTLAIKPRGGGRIGFAVQKIW